MFLMKGKNSDKADPGPLLRSQCQVPKADTSFCEERLMWHSYLWGIMTEKTTRTNSPEFQPLSYLTGFQVGRGRSPTCLDTVEVDWKRQSGFCALQQPRCFEAVPCCTVYTPPPPVEGKEDTFFKVNCSVF